MLLAVLNSLPASALPENIRPFDSASVDTIRLELRGRFFSPWPSGRRGAFPAFRTCPHGDAGLRRYTEAPVLFANLDAPDRQPDAVAMAIRNAGKGIRQ
ncbi:MAG: hypothetical protein WCV99_19925 [Sterolibacterium sp.]|jgi:hypothetical protein